MKQKRSVISIFKIGCDNSRVKIFTCVSDKLRDFASSFLSCPTTYWFFSKACSSFNNWLGEKAVRILFGLRKGNKNSGRWGPEEIEM